MILGIDVGGTHTDAVLIDRLSISKKAKVLTDQDNILDSLLKVTDHLLSHEEYDNLKRIVLSTTISTNSIVQDKIDKVGMILSSGPGLAPDSLPLFQNTRFVSGYVNHRGQEISAIDTAEVADIGNQLRQNNIRHLGIVGKFSTRNPGHELFISDVLKDGFSHISLGHSMSGNLNFPRRISTTYLNAATWDTYNSFVEDVLDFSEHRNIKAPIYILKADGGTFEIRQSAKYPVCTILSGPAASIMGIISLSSPSEDAIAIDIGGTTTDIALFAGGSPLLEPLGVTIGGYKTLIRGLRTKSIGLGGDSRVSKENGAIRIGPERGGPAAAFGGPYPTPTDAMIVLGYSNTGDKASAIKAIESIDAGNNTSVEDTARKVFQMVCSNISGTILTMIDEINNTPVYTVHEVMEGKTMAPKILYAVGGPACDMAPHIGKILECEVQIPEHSEVANAVGAALARTTAELTLLADTEKGILTIVEAGEQKNITKKFTHREATELCRERLQERAKNMGSVDDELEIEFTEDQSFNMVRSGFIAGKNIRIKAQIKPGLIRSYRKEKIT